MKLYIYQYGFVLDEATKIPVSGFLIQTDDGKNILVDTGFRKDDPFSGNLLVEEEDTVEKRLLSIGLTPRDIHYVICTHLDPDHCGYHDLFFNATFLIQKEHYELAKSGTSSRLQMYRKYWDLSHLNYQLIEGDFEFAPGIHLIHTPGHIIGHQSVLVKLPSFGGVIITGDAVFRQDEYMSEKANDFDKESHMKTNSIKKLKILEKEHDVNLLVFGHDPVQWPCLKKSPEYYQ
ncbi:N-acyl homoserine lactonase family protein [Paenibacillus durus]|uniref:Metallo-beta-lactamase domain-containing protein n=1 Tax=Paenibacillus durus ATCC 35681 TaxID=1333534 RepID=A0A0F7CGW5_PAEDU|nr:N-acyl homoserine lactonase family protein [Paenibacillus durus]AKG33856.1 hypothetical protein VK70_04025 [Paenibacillus durus ATCC 35681]